MSLPIRARLTVWYAARAGGRRRRARRVPRRAAAIGPAGRGRSRRSPRGDHRSRTATRRRAPRSSSRWPRRRCPAAAPRRRCSTPTAACCSPTATGSRRARSSRRALAPTRSRAGRALVTVRAWARASSASGPWRCPVRRLGRRQVVVVAARSLADVERLGATASSSCSSSPGPAALAATALGGWWLARKALLPGRADDLPGRGDRHRPTRRAHRGPARAGRDRPPRRRRSTRCSTASSAGSTSKHRLIADASHELRTPLAVMRAELDVTLRGDELTHDARAVLESVREEVGRMSRTVDNLLTLAEVDEGRLGLLPQRVVMRDAIEAAARPLQPLADAKHLQPRRRRRRVPGAGRPAAPAPGDLELHRERDQVRPPRRPRARHVVVLAPTRSA